MPTPGLISQREPRLHHFTPACWLAGFTRTGDKDGELWVTDLKRKRQWKSSPLKSGRQRDLYRPSDPELDPSAAEKAFSVLEDAVAPVLKRMDTERRMPDDNELEALLIFMAFQFVRVPAFRPTLLRIADGIHRAELSKALTSEETWRAFLNKIGEPGEGPGADYTKMKEFIEKREYTLSAEPEWFLTRGFQATKGIVPALKDRHWRASVCNAGDFIGSDNPVAIEGAPGRLVGFRNAEIVVFPVSRHFLLYGTNAALRATPLNRIRVAAHNTLTMLKTDEQLYSHVPNFRWLDETGAVQTDWRLFSKDRIIEETSKRGVGGRTGLVFPTL